MIIDDTGYYYKSIKEDLKKLTNRLWIQLPDNREVTVSWISDAEIIPLSGKVHIKFHEKLEPHLFYLSGQYTQYKLENVLSFHNKYAIRLFELFKSQVKQVNIDAGIETEIKYSIDELRYLLGVDKYPKWPEFERNVIRKAVEEINKYSDIFRVKYDTYKAGKSVSTIVFIVNYPSAIEIYQTHQINRQKMNMSRKKINRKPQTVKDIEKRVRTKAKKLNEDLEQLKQFVEMIENSGTATEEQIKQIKEARRIIEQFETGKYAINLNEPGAAAAGSSAGDQQPGQRDPSADDLHQDPEPGAGDPEGEKAENE